MKEIQALKQAIQSRKMAGLLLLGFASGLPLFLTTRTLQLWMKDAEVDVAKITLFGLVSLPYSLKFIWSPLIDRFSPPFLGGRRGWLFLTQIGLVIAILAMALQQPTQNTQILMTLAITSFIIAFLSATQDIAGDAYRTEILNPLEFETGASLWVLGYRIALFIAFSLAAWLAGFLSWNIVYLLMAGFMGIGLITTFFVASEPQIENSELSRNNTSLKIKDIIFLLVIITIITSLVGGVISETIPLKVFYWILGGLLITWISASIILPKPQLNEQQENITPHTLQEAVILPLQIFLEKFGITKALIILIFIILYKLGDSLVGITANLFAKEIKFDNQELATVYIIGLVATTVGVILGGIIMSRIGINRALWIFGVLQLLSNLGYYALAITGKDYSMLAIAIMIENTTAGLVTVATVAYLMSLCSHNFTTTQFALFSSLMALSRDVLSAPAGDWAKATGWPSFFLLSMVAALPGLLLLPLVAPWNSQAVPLSRPGLEEEEDLWETK
ncbi:MFS transporter [Sphaerospermopsis sp. LEGE 08334]|jgi:PAT family beta-lactamase induction signal transducer AmpG|uniref:AmpG family muropeptide MFS transporter n=1 Tax=Sphaerospermopsis sp. LEGE 08334 TaxID=1828651 RepID=UPI00187E54BB|nr:MFS transporter [Sphaerospermopsis sp. LEGE 08334]MBE9056034.1 MFS transporter [Sphaerospermopsis sp. LEGE 08334]